MNWKKAFLNGLIGSILSTSACLIYKSIYQEAFYVDFNQVMSTTAIVAACTIGCFLMAIGHQFGLWWKGPKTVGWLNIVYSLISFASIAGVLGFNLPLETESPEMFPGLAIPMHFFPVLSLLSIYPFFHSDFNPKP